MQIKAVKDGEPYAKAVTMLGALSPLAKEAAGSEAVGLPGVGGPFSGPVPGSARGRAPGGGTHTLRRRMVQRRNLHPPDARVASCRETTDLAQTPSRTVAGKGVPEPLVRGPPQTPGQPGNSGPANLFAASPRPAPPSGGLLERVVNAIVGDNDAEQRLMEKAAEWRTKEAKLQERIQQLEAQLQVGGRAETGARRR